MGIFIMIKQRSLFFVFLFLLLGSLVLWRSTEYIFLIAGMGMAAGFLGGISGVAGAPFLIAFLTLFLGYTQHAAQGTVLAMMLGPMSIMTVVNEWRLVRSRLTLLVACIVGYMVFSWLGASVAYMVDNMLLKKLFGMLLVVIGGGYAARLPGKPERKAFRLPLSVIMFFLSGCVIGFIGGMFGVGAGILLIPMLTILFGLDLHEARVLSLAVLCPPVSIGAVIRYMYGGRNQALFDAHTVDLVKSFFSGNGSDVKWEVAIVLLLSYILLNGIGAHWGKLRNDDTMKIIFGILLIVTGIINIAVIH